MNEREPYLSQINEILNLTKDYKETCDESEERRLAIAVIAKTRHLYKDLMAPILHHADEREGILTVLDRVLEKKNEFEEATDPVEIDRLALEVLEDFQFIESSLIGSVCQYAHGMFWPPLGEIEITPEAQRDYFVDILKWELPLTQEMRYSLVYGFRALNAGETPPLFSPTTTGNRHKKYTITAYQMMALLHIERIAVEEGITKEDAKKIVAAEYVKETDAIEKWRDRFDDFEKERLDRWLDFVRRTAPLAKKNIPPDDCWDKYLPHKPQEDVDQDGDFEHFMSVNDYELLFNGNNSLSECAKNHHRALNDEDVPLPDILFFPILPLN